LKDTITWHGVFSFKFFFEVMIWMVWLTVLKKHHPNSFQMNLQIQLTQFGSEKTIVF
jgi:hypothetical protein